MIESDSEVLAAMSPVAWDSGHGELSEVGTEPTCPSSDH